MISAELAAWLDPTESARLVRLPASSSATAPPTRLPGTSPLWLRHADRPPNSVNAKLASVRVGGRARLRARGAETRPSPLTPVSFAETLNVGVGWAF